MVDRTILAVDQGTYSTRAIVFDAKGRQLAVARQAVELKRVSDTQVEQSPMLLLDSVRTVIRQVLADPAVAPGGITAAGIATQRSSVVAWDRESGEPLGPVLSWQDRRAQPFIDDLAGCAAQVGTTTGLRLSAHYGGSKLHWLLQHSNRVRETHAAGRLLMGPLASYLLFQLLEDGPALVDHANASRTLLWNLETLDWDADMLALFELPRETLPACRPIEHAWGRLAGHGIPVCAVNGDQTAALYAQGEPAADTLVVNIGTGAFVLLPTDVPRDRPAGLLAGVSRSNEACAKYYIEGTVNGAGSALKVIADRFAVDKPADHLPGWLAAIDEPTLFINTVGGLGAPWWQAGPPAYFVRTDICAAEALVAVIESIVFLLQANITLLRRHNPGVRRIRIGGGLSNLDGLCQKLADLSGLEVHRPDQVEAAARGIAWQAAGGPAGWKTSAEGGTFAPRDNPRLQQRFTQFNAVLASSI
ncbi:MAG: hypothetical protein H6956_03810 [Chromatiaceae bacterium]|nr:hypothetical protein [Gammaproteobacteria bacterium]MCP5317033.1 hypothetical protein [Chromatiaceae bacterium]MCW5586656.1 hypothetical protein [Chromatiales bacterium]MCP5428710.1 hypothetical protein [Chromatiaceae bacterium]MCP5434561.1 hypothetical protein [Chromatiaceae bacterium]